MKYSPKGKHFGFEPLPYLYNELKEKYKNRSEILPFALADKCGTTTFQYVKNAPAYSGIKKRRYDIKYPNIEEIEVEIQTLDEIIPIDLKIDLIKIDVEGAEFGVLKGGIELLKKYKPIIIFEFGMGASDYYGTTAEDIYNLLVKEIGLKIYTLKSFLKKSKSLSLDELNGHFSKNDEYYFVASK